VEFWLEVRGIQGSNKVSSEEDHACITPPLWCRCGSGLGFLPPPPCEFWTETCYFKWKHFISEQINTSILSSNIWHPSRNMLFPARSFLHLVETFDIRARSCLHTVKTFDIRARSFLHLWEHLTPEHILGTSNWKYLPSEHVHCSLFTVIVHLVHHVHCSLFTVHSSLFIVACVSRTLFTLFITLFGLKACRKQIEAHIGLATDFGIPDAGRGRTPQGGFKKKSPKYRRTCGTVLR
jgi:hypothetical protein